MGVVPLLLGLLVALGGLVGSSVPVAAFTRTRDPRFLFVAGAELLLLVVGILAAYGNTVLQPPTYTQIPETPLALLAGVSLLLVLPGLLPRRR